ncbi:hypothetical protein [Mixta calida]|uniref:hypothetical protein n=1 Tax=Mixta calida TaxID=665913 RepID=UPI0011A72062|nr:hypothetical protein [Mixta calida]DAV72818.1 MAG TPA: hypothetical protein [Caudoviricetes sp.]
MKTRNPFSEDEVAYIRRVAGKVPVDVIARQLRRPVKNVQNWAYRRQIKLRVPDAVMSRYWQNVTNRGSES